MTNDDTDRTTTPVRSASTSAAVARAVASPGDAQARDDASTTLDALPDVASPEQVAAALGVSPKTIRAACRRGELRAARIRTLWRIRAVDVRALFGVTPDARGHRLPDFAPRPGRPGRPRKAR